jgi:hypothetical protein
MFFRTAIKMFVAALWLSSAASAEPETGVMDSSETPVILQYVPQENIDADNCQMWVNGFGDGTEHVYTAVGGQLYETWIQVNGPLLQSRGMRILNTGVFLRYTEQTTQNPEPTLKETFVIASQHASDATYFRTDFRYRWHNFEKETSRVVHNIAIFLDVEWEGSKVTRFWMSNNGKNYTLAEILNGYPLTSLITVGPGLRTMRYLENWSDSPILSNRKKCANRLSP